MGFLSDLFGTTDTYHSNVAGPDASAYQLPGMQQAQGQLAAQLAATQNVAAPQAVASGSNGAQFMSQGYGQDRSQQQGLAQSLAATANGQGMSAADQQLQQGLQTQLAQQRAATASAGSAMSPYLAQRQIANQAAQATQNTNAQMGIQRAQEAATAQGQLGGVLSGMSGQDIGIGSQNAQLNQQNQQFNAGQAQQTMLANQNANLNQQQINSQNAQYYTGQQLGVDQTQLQANMGYQAAQQQNQFNNANINAGVAAANTQAASAMTGAVLGGASAAFGGGAATKLFSDERLKENISREVDSDMKEFLGNLDPASYDYKNPALGTGRHWSVMAQSAQKSRAGQSFVVKTPQGLALDPRKGFGVALTALKHLSDRQEKLEAYIANPRKI